MPREIKLRKRLLSGAGQRRELVDVWSAALQRADFEWYVIVLSRKGMGYQGLSSSEGELKGSEAVFERYTSYLQQRDGQGMVIMDPSLKDDVKQALYSKRKSEYEHLVGPLITAASPDWPGLWVSDAIAYLLHRRVNARQDVKAEKDLWLMLREKVARSTTGEIANWGVKALPATEPVAQDEAEVLALFG